MGEDLPFMLIWVVAAGAIVYVWYLMAHKDRMKREEQTRAEAFEAGKRQGLTEGRKDYVDDVRVLCTDINEQFACPATEWGFPMHAKECIDRLSEYGFGSVLGPLERRWKADLESRIPYAFFRQKRRAEEAEDFEEYLLFEKGLRNFVREYAQFLIHPRVKAAKYNKSIDALGRSMRMRRIHELIERANTGEFNLIDHDLFWEIEELYAWLSDRDVQVSYESSFAHAAVNMLTPLLDSGRVVAEEVEFKTPERMNNSGGGTA